MSIHFSGSGLLRSVVIDGPVDANAAESLIEFYRDPLPRCGLVLMAVRSCRDGGSMLAASQAGAAMARAHVDGGATVAIAMNEVSGAGAVVFLSATGRIALRDASVGNLLGMSRSHLSHLSDDLLDSRGIRLLLAGRVLSAEAAEHFGLIGGIFGTWPDARQFIRDQVAAGLG